MKSRLFLIGLGLSSLFFATNSCQTFRSLELIWSVRRGLVGNWAVHGNEVFIVGRNLSVYDLLTGRELRTTRLPQDYGNTTLGKISPEITIANSSLVFAWYDFKGEFKGKEGKIFCYDPETLRLRWEQSVPLQKDLLDLAPTLSIVVQAGHVYALAIAKQGPNLFKLRLSDGGMVWSTTIEKYVQGTPLLTQGGKLLVRSRLSAKVGDQYGHLQAIDSDTGATVWQSRIDGGYLVSDDPPLISGDRAYVTSEASAPDMTHFYIIDVRNGTIIKHDLLPRVRPPFAERQGILYFGSARPASYRVSTGEMLWQMYLYGPEGLGPPVTANGVLDPIREEIYLGDWERHLYVLSAKTGEIKDKLNIRSYWRGDVLFNPLKAFFASYGVKRLELNQGLLLVGTVDSSLFVFRRTEKN